MTNSLAETGSASAEMQSAMVDSTAEIDLMKKNAVSHFEPILFFTAFKCENFHLIHVHI